jgi:hypothetical protein
MSRDELEHKLDLLADRLPHASRSEPLIPIDSG